MMPRAYLPLLCAVICMPAVSLAEVNPDSPVVKDFNRRVTGYVKLHKTALAGIHRLKPTNSPEAILQYQRGLAQRIGQARRDVGQGSIFTLEISAEFRRLIGVTMQGPEARRIRQSLQRAAPVHIPGMRVNSVYPAGLPLESTPPSLLLNLPALPPVVEYRVVGHDLVLRDVDANMVVDFIPNAIS